MAAREIELWFEFASTYSYLSVMRVEAAAAQRGVRIGWKPFLLGPIFKSFGWSTSPFNLQKEKGAYMWRDMARQCAKYGLPWRQPSDFPRLGVLPLRVVLAGEGEAWVGEFARRVMLRNFSEDREINSPEGIGEVLQSMNLPATELIAKAQSDPVKARLREHTDAAARRGIFGAPTFFAGKEMFWGNDRLDDALELAAAPG